MNLQGKKIVLGISGSIAAYKTPQLVRQLVKAGAEVKVICTTAAKQFVSPLSLSTVSRHPVLHDINDGDTWNNHVALGRWADLLLIAPCSANTLAKLALGLCDNLLCAVYLSAICPVFIAPAMDEDMWHHPATHRNLERVKQFGHHIIPVGFGELASGLVGDGRMAEPDDILRYLSNYFVSKGALPLSGKKVLVTAGPTYERIDPVRFIGNFSTGKMGIALADTFAEAGAIVTLVLGPTHLRPAQNNVTVVAVESAEEMYAASVEAFRVSDAAVLSAAVADFRPREKAAEKIKKGETALTIELEQNKDILAYLGSIKNPGQILVGFALETSDEMVHAQKKLVSKNADFIVLNSLKEEGAGFGTDTNKVTILSADGTIEHLPLLSKKETAAAIIQHVFNSSYHAT